MVAGPRAGRSRGVAMVTALAVVVIATALLAPGVGSERLAVARTANLIDARQASALAVGLEHWVAMVLADDAEADEVDHLGEPWATPVPGVVAGRGTASGALTDLRGRFNLNALVDRDGRVNTLHVARLSRLLAELALDPRLADPITDWLDSDDFERLPAGVESAYYTTLDPPYRAANRPFAAVSELRLVAGVDADTFAALAPHVSVLDDAAEINVNTATEAVLAALGPQPDRAALAAFVRTRRSEPMRGIADLRTQAAFASPLLELDGLGFTSDWFRLDATITLPRAWIRHHAVLRRVAGNVSTVRRWSSVE